MTDSFEASVSGHGIGSATVAVFVKDLNGQLNLESNKNQVATFQIKIPLADLTMPIETEWLSAGLPRGV